ncbi:hypothetical protein JL721_5867 [Aureococcus anophagefferens]|nr:hypothetical protein JL721_5867 [Aureococcus anophagefferens]
MVVEEAAPEGYAVVKYLGKRYKPCGDEAEGAKQDDGGDDDPLSSVPVYYARRRRFRRGEAGAAAHFQKLGYVVFAAALDGAEAATCLDKLWTFLEKCESKWFARTRPRVRECFAELWRAMAHPRADPRDLDAPGGLCVSLDGGCAWRPGLRGQKGWQHVDQNPLLKPGFECIQGLVSLTRTSKAAGGNLLVERSHADVFPRLVDLYPEQVRSRDGDDFFSLPRAAARRDGLLGGDGGGRHVVVHLEAGDLLCRNQIFNPTSIRIDFDLTELENSQVWSGPPKPVVGFGTGDLLCWDSRTVHCSWPGDGLLDEPGAPPAKADQLPTDRLARAALYVSFTPRSLVPPDVAAKRRQAVADGATTTHWASVCRRRDIVPKDMSDYERSRFRAQPTPPLSPEALMLI